MKKLLINIGLFAAIVLLITSCKKELEEKFDNPNQAKDPSIPGYFTAILNSDRVRPSYWNVSTFLLRQPAIYSQTAFYLRSNTMYQASDGYIDDYWKDFYRANGNNSGPLPLFRLMEKTYAALPETGKASNEIFMRASKVILYDQLSRMVDLWGDVPFSEAGSLASANQIKNPKFDEQQQLYAICISGLDSAADFFSKTQTTAAFNKADILLSGSVDKWRRYANSLKLRLLMRLSNVNETLAKTEVTKMLSNQAAYPLVDGAMSGTYSPQSSDILLRPLTDYVDNLNGAFNDWSNYPAPDFMLNKVMVPSGDPRIPYMFDKYGRTVDKVFIPNKTYRAMPIDFAGSQSDSLGRYAIWDSVTFLRNSKLPGVLVTAAEVNFLKAEAYERWGFGDAAETYRTAVNQSITFYYYLYSISGGAANGPSIANPTSEERSLFLSQPLVAYSGSKSDKLTKIWTQAWLDYGVLRADQAWSSYRRTNYPQLTFPTSSLQGYQSPPVRLVYPSSERGYNLENYQAVQAKDTRDTKIFWDVN